ncbi:MAG: S8 family serine peptidase, partial [Bacteroidota bacterium]
ILIDQRLIGSRKLKNTYLLKLNPAENSEALFKIFSSQDIFEFVERNHVVYKTGKEVCFQTLPNDDLFSRQYALHNTGNFPLYEAEVDADVDMDLAWDISTGSAEIVLAILDTGVRRFHPELRPRHWINPNEIRNFEDTDENGYVDDQIGWDFVNDKNSVGDDDGHGTHVTGIAAATGNNELGYAGADWNCQIMTCKVLSNTGTGSSAGVIEGIYYAVDNGANVINMSLGSNIPSPAYEEAINHAYDNNVTVVAAMGNDNTDLLHFPAAYANAIAVGASKPDDDRAAPFPFGGQNGGSNFGDYIDVIAPGSLIYGLSSASDTDYSRWFNGTSQASPLVAGIATLMLSVDPDLTPDEIRSILRSTAEDQVGDPEEDTEGFDVFYGYGRVNAFNALSTLSSTSTSNLSLDNRFQLFPNPAKERATIKSDYQFDRIIIQNILGAEVLNIQITPDDRHTIDTKYFPSGSYIIQISSEDEQKIGNKKLIISK